MSAATQRRLEDVRDWAQHKIDSHQEPPWAWYQYMKLIETCDAILAGMKASKPPGRELRAGPSEGNVVQLVSPADDDDEPPQMPM